MKLLALGIRHRAVRLAVWLTGASVLAGAAYVSWALALALALAAMCALTATLTGR